MGHTQPKPPDLVTLAEFYAMSWSDDLRRELHDGHVVAMAPPKNAHGTLTANLVHALKTVLRGRRPCRVQTEAGIIPPDRPNSYYQVDLLVTCEPSQVGARDVPAPLLIAEVLSESTQHYDRKRKLPAFRAMPSVRELVLIDSDRMFVELHRRLDETRWLTELVQGPGDLLTLESVGLRISLAELYEDVALPPEDDELPPPP